MQFSHKLEVSSVWTATECCPVPEAFFCHLVITESFVQLQSNKKKKPFMKTFHLHVKEKLWPTQILNIS